jgi:hypothetical protein
MRTFFASIALVATLYSGGYAASPLLEGVHNVTVNTGAENRQVVGKGATSDYYGYYGNYYNNLAGYYGLYGMYANDYSSYYSAYYYQTLAAESYYNAYLNAGTSTTTSTSSLVTTGVSLLSQ